VTLLLLTIAASYFLGSIPFGYILVRIFRGQDIRQTGSGNIGATNVARSSPWLGGLTLLLDAAKGSAAVFLAVLLGQVGYLGVSLPQSTIAIRAAIAAFSAIVGHVFPIWLKFKGGKGVATGLGTFMLLAPSTTLIMVAVFVVIVAAFRYVSLASIIAVGLFPVAIWLLGDYRDQPLVLGLISCSAILIVLKHHENIRRLISGEEPRFQLRHG
jgi:acyl phosphate:glycerol-3-phosphate acyltransferase